MKEFPDDELDKLFRKSSDELDPTFDPDDWNALKKKLDAHDGRTGGSWWKKWWPAGVLALLMVGGVITYVVKDGESQNKNANVLPAAVDPTHKTYQQDSIRSAAVTGENISGEQHAGEKTIPKDGGTKKESERIKDNRVTGKPEDNLAKTESSEADFLTKDKKILPRRWSKTGGVYLEPDRSIGRRVDGASYSKNEVAELPAIADKRNSVEVEQLENEVTEQIRPESKINDNVRFGTESKNLKDDAKSVSAIEAAGNGTVNTDQENAIIKENRLSISANLLSSRPASWKGIRKLPVIAKAEEPVSEPAKPAEQKQIVPKFAVRFGFSPDLSTVGFKNFSKPGTAVSLLLEYAVLRKLYIQSGVIRSSKVYNAKAGEYEWPANWSDQKTLPISVDATCKIIEIPLNFRYDISQSTRSRWFAGTGVSSYYMQNEKYDYNYPKYSHDIKWPDHEASTGWFLLSHVNASVGYEYRFSEKLSLLAEPYVRIPIKEVGFGKVNLFTTGIWFSIRYTPVFK